MSTRRNLKSLGIQLKCLFEGLAQELLLSNSGHLCVCMPQHICTSLPRVTWAPDQHPSSNRPLDLTLFSVAFQPLGLCNRSIFFWNLDPNLGRMTPESAKKTKYCKSYGMLQPSWQLRFKFHTKCFVLRTSQGDTLVTRLVVTR